MTSSIKIPSMPEGPAKPAGSTRAQPVCLEVLVTLRSLPGEAGSPAQPIREELKTVIVFDNGAVLRSANNLPAGLTLILSHARSRDVVCRVVTGRSMPAVKGYVEIEFIEPVKDFWGIHEETTPAPSAPTLTAAPQAASTPSGVMPAVPPIQQQTSVPHPIQRQVPAPPPPVFSRPRVSPELPAISPGALAGTPEFDEFPGPMSASTPQVTRESKLEPVMPPSISAISSKPAPEKPLPESDRAPATNPNGQWAAMKPATPLANDAMGAPTSESDDLMLTAFEDPAAVTAPPISRIPAIVGAAALVLAAVCGLFFFMHHGSAATPVASAAPASAPATTQPATISNPPAPLQAARQTTTSAPPQAEPQPQAQTIAAQPVRPETTVAPIPAAKIANTLSADSHADSSSPIKEDKSESAPKQSNASPTKRPTLSSLKIGAPSAPRKNLADGGDAPAPITVASNESQVGSTPGSLLASSGRAMPLAPVSAPVAPVSAATDPKLISSTRPVYPQAARQANIAGSVTLVIYIDQTGKVSSARAISGPVMLRAAAEEAVKQWKYSPALEDGKPAQSHTIVKVDFKLN